MNNSKFIVAKYIPDIDRNEPINIGVIGWVKGVVKYRFNCVEDLKIEDEDSYTRWIRYWSELCDSRSIQVMRDQPITKMSARFLDSLKKTADGSFTFGSVGESIDEVEASKLDDFVNFMFDRIVAKPKSNQTATAIQQKTGIVQKCRDIFKSLDLIAELQTSYKMTFKFGDAEDPVDFHYAIEKPEQLSLFNRINLDNSDSIHSSVWKFENAKKAERRREQVRIALFDTQGNKENYNEKMKLIGEFSNPVDVDDHDLAVEKIGNILVAA